LFFISEGFGGESVVFLRGGLGASDFLGDEVGELVYCWDEVWFVLRVIILDSV
jgi:hypothetical protein